MLPYMNAPTYPYIALLPKGKPLPTFPIPYTAYILIYCHVPMHNGDILNAMCYQKLYFFVPRHDDIKKN